MRRLRQLRLILGIVVLTSGALTAEEFERPVFISTTVIPGSELENLSLGKVISDAVVLQLKLETFEVTAVDTAQWPPPNRNQDFLIISSYIISDDEISVDIICFESGGNQNQPISSAAWTGPLSLEMDREIQRIISDEIAPSLPKSIEVTEKETEKAAEAGESWAIAALPATTDVAAEEKMADSAALSRWRIGIIGSVYLPLSVTASYADTGWGGSISAGYYFKAGNVNLGLGITTGAMYFGAEAASAATALFIPVGAEFRLGAALPGILQPWLKLAGGMSWFQLDVTGSEAQSKFVPYAEGSLGLDIFFGPTFGLTVEAAFRFVFEGSVTLYHVAPGIGAVVRF